MMQYRENPNLCAAVSCETKSKHKKQSNIIIPVVASVAGAIVLIAAASLIVFLVLKRRPKGIYTSNLVSQKSRIQYFISEI